MTQPTAAVSAPTGQPPKRLLRNYLLNPGFQLKYTGMICAVAVLLMLGLGVVIWRTADTAASQAEAAATQAERAMRESQTSSRIIRMEEMARAADNPDLVHTIEQQLAESDRQAERNLAQVLEQHAQIAHNRMVTLYSLIASGLILVVVLGLMGIVITHKLVGPVFKLKRLLRKVGSGRLDIRERLRKGDELGDLFDTFMEMVESLKRQQREEIAKLDAAILQAEAAGAGVAADHLKALREHMQVALEQPEATGVSMMPPLSAP